MRIRKTKVTVVTEHVFTFAEHHSAAQAQCEKCGAPLRNIQLNEAAATSGVSMERFQREFEAKGFHFTEAANGTLFICLNSSSK